MILMISSQIKIHSYFHIAWLYMSRSVRYLRAARNWWTHREKNFTSAARRQNQRSMIWFIIGSFDDRSRSISNQKHAIPVSNAARPLCRSAVPMSHQRLVERPRSHSHPYASTTGIWISLAKYARPCHVPQSSLAVSSPENQLGRTLGRGRRYWDRLGSNRKTPGPPRP